MTGELLAALLAAAAAGFFNALVIIHQRRATSNATHVAIAAEVASLLAMNDRAGFREYLRRQADAIRSNSWDGKAFFVDVRSDFAPVFTANSGNLGLLGPNDAAQIVRFYSICRAIVDLSRPDGRLAGNPDREFVAENMIRLDHMFDELHRIGQTIIKDRAVDPFIPG